MPVRTPESPLRQEHKLLRAPLPDELSHQVARAAGSNAD
jgi:hypothetical protein